MTIDATIELSRAERAVYQKARMGGAELWIEPFSPLEKIYVIVLIELERRRVSRDGMPISELRLSAELDGGGQAASDSLSEI